MSKKKRIGIDARLLYQTGVGVYLRNLLFHLSKIDNKNVQYLIFSKKTDWDRFSAEYTLGTWNVEFRTCNVAWHSFSEQILFLWQLLRADLDLVHFSYFSWPVLYPKPFVATIHDTILLNHATGRASTLPLWLYKIKQYVFRIVFSEQVRRAQSIFVPSDVVKKELIGFYPNSKSKIVVTHEGVDEVFARSVAQKPAAFPYVEKSYFLYVGNCYPHKNVELLLKAIIQHKCQIPNSKFEIENLKLVLVGPRSIFADRLKEKYKELGDNVLWLHDAKVEELKWLYENAKALVFPSKAEGYGLPIVEAMSVGCPLILSDIPVFHEVAGENATYFGVDDIDGLATELSKEMQNKNTVRTDATFSDLAKKTFHFY